MVQAGPKPIDRELTSCYKAPTGVG
jgi:hypothetical protein